MSTAAAQPGEELTRLVRGYRIASILNLRGGSRDDPWYVAELHVARDQGLEFYDLPMSACRRPTRRELLVLLDSVRALSLPAAHPLQVGLGPDGSGICPLPDEWRGEPPGRAVRGFTLKHGHVPLFGPEHLHEPFREYEAWLEARGLDHSPARFRDWVEHDYQADDLAINIPRLPPGPRALFEVDKDNGISHNPDPAPRRTTIPGIVSLRGWGWKLAQGERHEHWCRELRATASVNCM